MMGLVPPCPTTVEVPMAGAAMALNLAVLDTKLTNDKPGLLDDYKALLPPPGSPTEPITSVIWGDYENKKDPKDWIHKMEMMGAGGKRCVDTVEIAAHANAMEIAGLSSMPGENAWGFVGAIKKINWCSNTCNIWLRGCNTGIAGIRVGGVSEGPYTVGSLLKEITPCKVMGTVGYLTAMAYANKDNGNGGYLIGGKLQTSQTAASRAQYWRDSRSIPLSPAVNHFQPVP